MCASMHVSVAILDTRDVWKIAHRCRQADKLTRNVYFATGRGRTSSLRKYRKFRRQSLQEILIKALVLGVSKFLGGWVYVHSWFCLDFVSKLAA
jgi:hypothetical protein